MTLIEMLCVHYPHFGCLYHRCFYQPVIEREIALAQLQPGERVLHIGGGSYPFTALQLAAYGCHVCLIDNDRQAISNAERIITRSRLSHLIQVKHADGMETSGRGFDAVWISLLVQPKKEIVERLLKTLSEHKNKRIIYRNPRGIFKYFYPAVDPNLIAPQYKKQLARQLAKKESVLIAHRGIKL